MSSSRGRGDRPGNEYGANNYGYAQQPYVARPGEDPWLEPFPPGTFDNYEGGYPTFLLKHREQQDREQREKREWEVVESEALERVQVDRSLDHIPWGQFSEYEGSYPTYLLEAREKQQQREAADAEGRQRAQQPGRQDPAPGSTPAAGPSSSKPGSSPAAQGGAQQNTKRPRRDESSGSSGSGSSSGRRPSQRPKHDHHGGSSKGGLPHRPR